MLHPPRLSLFFFFLFLFPFFLSPTQRPAIPIPTYMTTYIAAFLIFVPTCAVLSRREPVRQCVRAPPPPRPQSSAVLHMRVRGSLVVVPLSPFIRCAAALPTYRSPHMPPHLLIRSLAAALAFSFYCCDVPIACAAVCL